MSIVNGVASVTSHIRVLREQKVLLDTDLAGLYGVKTSVLVQAVKRNIDPQFPRLRATSCFSSTPRTGTL